ncbi:MAG: PQQ-dependent sugar dehydrogenase [Paraglaciecola sp.]|uniref:PQQ-dependent sugar dehydrogenase n=1 Tax=Paraglaciecola sp. TaxID=1920173 RepID=UPI00329A4933
MNIQFPKSASIILFGKRVLGILLATSALVISLFSVHSHAEERVESLYQNNCKSCHGITLAGGMADSLLNETWLKDGSPESLAHYIRNGVASRGMPAWKETLSEEQIRALVIYISEQRHEKKRVAAPTNSQAASITALGHTFKIDTLHIAESILWAVEYLPDNTMLVTQRDGALLHVSEQGKLLSKIEGLPDIWHHVQGGLLDITLHPDYASNGWIYIAYASSNDGKTGITKIARGKIKDNTWSDHEDIFEASQTAHTDSGRHFGARIVFHDGYVYFAIGERGNRPSAQDLSLPNGKIFRLHYNGQVPHDNPFIKLKGALPGIWSFGHRNPQGLAIEPNSDRLWESEHGPRGGDEINLIKKGANYGWPIITYGMNYDGTPITHITEREGMEQPKHYWVPSIAVAGIAFYDGKMFTNWQGKMLAGGMGIQELQLINTAGDSVTNTELILSDRGRIRDVSVAPDGAIILVVTIDGKGHILRLAI